MLKPIKYSNFLLKLIIIIQNSKIQFNVKFDEIW